jgi:hypothetical protein
VGSWSIVGKVISSGGLKAELRFGLKREVPFCQTEVDQYFEENRREIKYSSSPETVAAYSIVAVAS